MSTVQQDLRTRNLTLPEAVNMAQNRSLWTMWSTYGATQSWVACQKRRRRHASIQTAELSRMSLMSEQGQMNSLLLIWHGK